MSKSVKSITMFVAGMASLWMYSGGDCTPVSPTIVMTLQGISGQCPHQVIFFDPDTLVFGIVLILAALVTYFMPEKVKKV